jgi:hypothetical protein
LVLAELLENAGEGDFLRAVAEAVLQLLMETDVEGLIGAGRYQRSGERTTWRNAPVEAPFGKRHGEPSGRGLEEACAVSQEVGLRLSPWPPTGAGTTHTQKSLTSPCS